MHVALAPGETLLPGTEDDLEARFADPRVAAVLVPLVPRGIGPLPRAARRYLAAWDGRFLHAQNYFAPATRVAMRRAPGGWHNADAAPELARALARGERIEALRASASPRGVDCDIARDLTTWSAHFAAEGAAWAERAAATEEFARFAPAPWLQHNLLQAGRRAIEVLQATRRADPLVWLLHATRESAFSRTPSARQH